MTAQRSQADDHVGTPRMAAYFGVTTQTILRWGKAASGILTNVEVMRNGGQKVMGYKPHHIQEAAVKLQYSPADIERVSSRIVSDKDAPARFRDQSLRLLNAHKETLETGTAGKTGA